MTATELKTIWIGGVEGIIIRQRLDGLFDCRMADGCIWSGVAEERIQHMKPKVAA
jgi:hypothetical protein